MLNEYLTVAWCCSDRKHRCIVGHERPAGCATGTGRGGGMAELSADDGHGDKG